MDELLKIEIEDKIILTDVNTIVKDFIKEQSFPNLNVDYLRDLCLLKNAVRYKVVEVCQSCRRVQIAVSKMSNNVTVWIKYNQISSVCK